jgi:dihydrofolate synthase/folylpolyglutamate synthase
MFAACLTKVAQVIEKMVKEGLPHPTPFEIETAVAFLYFKEMNCDLVVLETGMGGLLDATNLITTTLVAVITSISMDHMGFLGDTLTEIARNKAGIIKSGSTVVSVAQKPEAMAVVRGMARKYKAPLYVADREQVEQIQSSYRGQTFLYQGKQYEIALPGVYQKENAAAALTVFQVLQEKGYEISQEAIRKGMKNTLWGGRFTLLGEDPVFIIDGAHNPDAAKNLAASVEEYFPGRNIYYIVGMFRDKDYDQVAKITAGYAREIYTVATPGSLRALPAEELAKTLRKYNSHVTSMNSLQDAVDVAYRKAGKEDVIIAFGSLSFLGNITEIVNKRQEKE